MKKLFIFCLALAVVLFLGLVAGLGWAKNTEKPDHCAVTSLLAGYVMEYKYSLKDKCFIAVMEHVVINGQGVEGNPTIYFRSKIDEKLDYQDVIWAVIENPACTKTINVLYLKPNIYKKTIYQSGVVEFELAE